MKKIVFLGSKKIGWQCFQYLLDQKSKLDIEIIQIGTNLKREDEYKDHFLEISSRLSIPIIDQKEDQILECDYIISVQYHHILSSEQIAQAKIQAFNLHMAPLPEYRGCNQFSMAILDKSPIFGTSIHIMDQNIDHGAIVAEDRWDIAPDVWVEDLYLTTEERSFNLFQNSIENLLTERYDAVPQQTLISHRNSSLHYRNEITSIKKLELDWSEEKIHRHIRATYMPGFPAPYFIIAGQKVEVKIP